VRKIKSIKSPSETVKLVIYRSPDEADPADQEVIIAVRGMRNPKHSLYSSTPGHNRKQVLTMRKLKPFGQDAATVDAYNQFIALLEKQKQKLGKAEELLNAIKNGMHAESVFACQPEMTTLLQNERKMCIEIEKHLSDTVMVHSGMNEYYASIRGQLLAAIMEQQPCARVVFTGFSMGGPIACLAALDYMLTIGVSNHTPAVIRTFASVRSGNEAFRRLLAEHCPDHDSLYIKGDVLGEFPPNSEGYKNAGNIVLIADNLDNVEMYGAGSPVCISEAEMKLLRGTSIPQYKTFKLFSKKHTGSVIRDALEQVIHHLKGGNQGEQAPLPHTESAIATEWDAMDGNLGHSEDENENEEDDGEAKVKAK
jgi:hypothetical protein